MSDVISPSPSTDSSSTESDRPLVVGLGGSAGAVEALQHFFDAVPEEPGLAFVVVMHLAPEETSHMAEVLQDHTSMPVTQVSEPVAIEADHVYVVAPGQTLVVEETTLVPSAMEGQKERRHPIDRFFRSLAKAPLESIGVVFSGAGTDGSLGLRAITEAGGLTAAQDPGEAAHDSMPRSAVETSRVDLVLPVADLARRLCEQRAILRRLQELGETEEVLPEEKQEILQAIFEQVRSQTGHDFSQYKRSTMLRRIRRRLQVHQIASLDEYRAYLDEHPGEATALQKDLLISVTNFFRNPEAYGALREEVLPSLLSRKGVDDELRAWVVGCASGEEAYSIAMLLLEQAAKSDLLTEQIQIFASDLDEGALATAREGRYPEAVSADVPERYLDRFFRKDGAEYVVQESVQERVLFTPHDLLRDPPFSNLDLISCRNLLIYLRRDLQRSVFDLFSYALNEEGYLFLGNSESVDLSDDLFQPVRKTHRLYQRQKGPRTVPELPALPLSSSTIEPPSPDPLDTDRSSEAALHRRLLESYAPPSVVVNEDHTFLHLSQTAGRYLQHPGGTPNSNIVDIVRPELRVKLRSALREAFDQATTVRTRPVTVQFDGDARPVRLVVRPAQDLPEASRLALVVFIESEEEEVAPDEDLGLDEQADGRTERLESELDQTKKELRSTLEEYETSKQEMRAANEELRSMNEEYKSMTEELETSKEELQSVNEELKTVNRELEEKVDALQEANSDLKNLMASTNIGTLFLDGALCIRRYTPRIEEFFSVRDSDLERPVSELTHQLQFDELEADAREVLDTQDPVEREVRSEQGNWFLVRYHPYRPVEAPEAGESVEGVVISFVDITRRVEAEQDLRASHKELQDRTEQVQALSRALTSAEERERKRISKILHDDLQQTMFAARMRVDHLQEQSTFDTEQSGLAARAIELLDEGVEKARTLSHELDPPVGDQSLRDSLDWLALQMEDSYGLSVAVLARGAAKTTDKNLRYLLFRLVRELLFNVVKHADVDEATVLLVEGEDRLRVVVEDEGAGFDPDEQLQGEAGLGLVGVRERIEMIGGTFTVDSAPGEGTRVAIEVSLDTDVLEPTTRLE